MRRLPKLYPILDAAVLESRGTSFGAFVDALGSAGVMLLQYRDKHAAPQVILRNAAVIAAGFAGSGATLLMNDRADLAVLAGWDGVHVGQEDLSPEHVKAILAGAGMPGLETVPPPRGWNARSADEESDRGRIVGVSTHSEAQVMAADAGVADYVAIGPVFVTQTKADASAAVGLDGVRRARALTRKPLVAIGGITREDARSVIEAGADSVAVISGLFVGGESVEKVTRDFLEILG